MLTVAHLTYRSCYLIVFLLLAPLVQLSAQCENHVDQNLSSKIANYTIIAELDRKTHTAYAQQTVTWTNSSPEAVSELRLYMYMNAFKTRQSTFLRGVNDLFGTSLSDWQPHELGQIAISKIISGGTDLTDRQIYIQPNDGNVHDETVLALSLPEPVAAGERITLSMEFAVKLPKTIARSGYSKNDFHLFVHWFPQLGVFEEDEQGVWGWNCHQFMQKTEFYADFGNYDVTLTTDEDFVIGATGCRVSETVADGKKTSRFVAHDVIDFGWTAYPLYQVYTDKWRAVDIELLIPAEHCMHVPRYLRTVKQALEYMDTHVGPYHYPKITLVDPPMHGLSSGFMEYPMLITCASVYGAPDRFRGIESLIIHEFVHMYYMATLANNEKEEAWLDEGFVTFYEDKILDHYYGPEGSFYDFGIWRTANIEKSRQEYTTQYDPSIDVIAQPGWEFKGNFKATVYSKMSTTLHTFENIIGSAAFERLMKYYYKKHAFSHPSEEDWLAAVDSIMSATADYQTVDHKAFWQQALHTVHTIDYAVVDVSDLAVGKVESTSQSFTIDNLGDFDLAAEIQVTFADGEVALLAPYEGTDPKVYSVQNKAPITRIEIDPEQKILLDLNLNNNSYTATPDRKGPTVAANSAGLVSEIVLHILNFLL